MWIKSMWPFGRKNLDIAKLSSIDYESGAWSLAVDDCDSPTFIVCRNSDAKRWFRHPLLSTRIELGIRLTPSEKGNDPSKEDVVLDEFEDM